MSMPGGLKILERCDGCRSRESNHDTVVAAVCTYHWHYFCAACLRIATRRDVTDADRPFSHRTIDTAMRATWCWCPIGCDPDPTPTEVLALFALARSA